MADEETSILSEGDAGNQPQKQDLEGISQETVQDQSSDSTQKVGSREPDASRIDRRGRSFWANQRIIEKTVNQSLQRALTEQLAPILETLKSSIPQASQPATSVQDQPDWNDINTWLNRRVESLLEQRLKQELGKSFNEVKNKLSDEMKYKSRLQEARNYLLSQKDIGRDEVKLAEVRQVMTDNLLDYALESEPLEATIKAVDIWRQLKLNPNAPLKSHLTGITGGAETQSNRELNLKELLKLQKELASNPTIEEQEKLHRTVDNLSI